jgi:hypothetical protein
MVVHYNRRTKKKGSNTSKRNTLKVGGSKHNDQIGGGGVIISRDNNTITLNKLIKNKKKLIDAIEHLPLNLNTYFQYKLIINKSTIKSKKNTISSDNNIEYISNTIQYNNGVEFGKNILNTEFKFAIVGNNKVKVSQNDVTLQIILEDTIYNLKFNHNEVITTEEKINQPLTAQKTAQKTATEFDVNATTERYLIQENNKLRKLMAQLSEIVKQQDAQLKSNKSLTHRTKRNTLLQTNLCQGLEKENIHLKEQIEIYKRIIESFKHKLREIETSIGTINFRNAGPKNSIPSTSSTQYGFNAEA